jgi:hypothetical protein
MRVRLSELGIGLGLEGLHGIGARRSLLSAT